MVVLVVVAVAVRMTGGHFGVAMGTAVGADLVVRAPIGAMPLCLMARVAFGRRPAVQVLMF